MAAAGLAACGGKESSLSNATPSIFPPTGGPRVSLSPCQFPPRIASPTWIPAGLPLPAGTYATKALPTAQGFSRGQFVVPGSLRSFVTFILAEWPKHGWKLGRGEAEEDEVEDTFTRPPAELGSLKANEQPCSPGYVLLLLAYTPDRLAAGSVTPGQTPLPATNTG